MELTYQVQADLSQPAWVIFPLGPSVCLSVYSRMALEGAGVELELTSGMEGTWDVPPEPPISFLTQSSGPDQCLEKHLLCHL